MSGRAALCAVLACVIAPDLAIGETNKAAHGIGPDVVLKAEELVVPDAPLEKPAHFESWGERLDYIDHNLSYRAQQVVTMLDTSLAKDGERLVETPPSRFRLGLYTELEARGGISFAVDPTYDLEVDLPNLERRWKIVVTGREIDELPGTNPTERDQGLNIGVQKPLDRLHLSLGVGVRARWLPEAYSEVKWAPNWGTGPWRARPQVKGYYVTDDGFGQVSSFSIHRWAGERERLFLRSVSAARWTEETLGVEWEQSFSLGLVPELLERRGRGEAVSVDNTARVYGLRGSVFGHKSGEGVVDRYRLTFLVRYPVYRRILFLEVAPELEWKNEEDWGTVSRLRIGLDMLFWGVNDSLGGS